MPAQPLSVSALIAAPARTVYGIIADYHDGHPRILPRPPFVSLEVEAGGTGAGTAIRVEMRMLGRTGAFRAVVTEPRPGQVLVETNDNGHVTTFTVEPRSGGRHSQVTIATTFAARRGLPGALERWLLARLLRPVYARELALLAAVAAGGAAT